MIRVNRVTLEYQINRMDRVTALQNVSFSIKPGERVGLIGLNGAGKSSTIKLLTGIIKPTYGEVSLFGKDPFKNRKEICYNYGVMFGQRSQLNWDLPVIDSFFINGSIYGMSAAQVKNQIDHFTKWLKIDYWNMPVRKLSLGRRVICDVLLSILHKPQVLFLDESTIALDVVNKKKVLEMISMLNKETGTALFLTSHQLDDIESVCDRIIILNKGKIYFDGFLEEFINTSSIKKVINIHSTDIERNILKIKSYNEGIRIDSNANGFCIFISEEDEKYDELVNILTNDPELENFEIRRINLEERILLMEG